MSCGWGQKGQGLGRVLRPLHKTTAALLLQCLIMIIIIADAVLSLKFFACNTLHKLTVQLWVGTKKADAQQSSTPRLGVLGPIHKNDCSLTVPMSHYEYDKLLCRVEIGIHLSE